MLNDRENLIRRTVDDLRASHNISNFEGLRQAVTERGILVIESPEVIIPSTSYSPKLEKIVIFTRKPRFRNLRHWYLAHESGHALLGHQGPDRPLPPPSLEVREGEADLFAKFVRGRADPGFEFWWDAIEMIMKHGRETRKEKDPEHAQARLSRVLNAHISRSLSSQGR